MTRRGARPDDCQVLLEQLSAYLDGDLAASACASLERHARTCRRCARAIADLRRTTGLCQRAATAPLPPAVRRRAKQRVAQILRRRT